MRSVILLHKDIQLERCGIRMSSLLESVYEIWFWGGSLYKCVLEDSILLLELIFMNQSCHHSILDSLKSFLNMKSWFLILCALTYAIPILIFQAHNVTGQEWLTFDLIWFLIFLIINIIDLLLKKGSAIVCVNLHYYFFSFVVILLLF